MNSFFVHFLYAALLLLTGCTPVQSSDQDGKQEVVSSTVKPIEHTGREVEDSFAASPKPAYSTYEESLLAAGFLDVASIQQIKVHLPYASRANFTQQVLYDSLQHAFLQPFAFEKLKQAQAFLQQQHPSYTIIVYDAFRPNVVQQQMWSLVQGTPKQKYVAHPKRGSIHNFGLAVDCSIFHLGENRVLDMGTDFDHLGYEAEYRHNQQLVANGSISPQAKSNRELLRSVMQSAGFRPINSEWWHFNALSVQETRQQYQMR